MYHKKIPFVPRPPKPCICFNRLNFLENQIKKLEERVLELEKKKLPCGLPSVNSDLQDFHKLMEEDSTIDIIN